MILHVADDRERLAWIRDGGGRFSTLLGLFPSFVLWIQLGHAIDLGVLLGGCIITGVHVTAALDFPLVVNVVVVAAVAAAVVSAVDDVINRLL